MAEDRLKHAEKAKSRISEYLQNLSENPSINKDFNRYLKEINGKFDFKGINIERELQRILKKHYRNQRCKPSKWTMRFYLSYF